MIRLNLVAVLILAAFGWVIDGYVQAATPISPQGNMDTVRELLNIVKPNQNTAPAKKLEGRTPAVKASVLYWPEEVKETEDVRLMIKFHDRYKIRLDPTGQAMSTSGENIDSLSVILEGLNVSLEPVFKVDEFELKALLRRAERLSGKQQPDLAANFYVNGDRNAVEQAAMILLHDPRVEWAAFDKREDPRKAIALREQQAALQQNAPAMPANDAEIATESWQSDSQLQSQYSSIEESTYDGGGQLISKESKEVDFETRAGAGSCCVWGDGLDGAPMASAIPGEWVGGPPPAVENPFVIRSCIDVANNNECDDLEGIFTKGSQCNPTVANFSVCNQMALQGFVRTGACCVEGSVEVMVDFECLAEDGIFMHDAYSRFDGTWAAGVPVLSTRINPQLLASAYGLTNFNYGGGDTNYSYYYGIPPFGPPALETASQLGPLVGMIPVEPLNNTNYNGPAAVVSNVNTNATAVYSYGLVDAYISDTGGPKNTPAYGNGGAPISGGFTFGQQKTAAGVIYDPNLFLASPNDVLCEFGVCALDCWLPSGDGPCGPDAGSGVSGGPPVNEPLSPILSSAILPPSTNVLCSSFVYEITCDSMRFRSSGNQYNPSGSLFQNLVTGVPLFPAVAGCQTDNDPADDDKSWFRDYFLANELCCTTDNPDCTYEQYVPEEDGEVMRGNCFFSNASYPTMLINQAGDLQIQGIGFNPPYENGCYGGGGLQTEESQCAASCETTNITDEICAVAPICCDPTQCGDEIWFAYAGWSFVCADLAAQYAPAVTGGLAATIVTDFDQTLKLGGPYPQYNPLGLVTPVLRNADGSVQDINPAAPGIQPFVLPAPNSCKITYGVQNQCYTAYFTEYQPSLGDASNDLLPPYGRSLTPGCSDFECCHRVCSINPAQTDYNYSLCCAEAWTEECVDKAQEICYTSQGGVVSTATPDFAPLQFHLSQKTARGPRPMSSAQYQNGLRRLAPAPLLPPSIVSPIPNLATLPPDNWLQSIYSMQWIRNPLLLPGLNQNIPLALSTSVAIPSVLGESGVPGLAGGLTINIDNAGQFVPVFGNINDPANPMEFFYGEPPSTPVRWWSSEGLSLYGNSAGQGWPQDPSFLNFGIGLYSWGTYIASFRPGNHPWGPYVNGTAGAGINIAVLDTSAWVQEYVDNTGFLVGAIHEDLPNVIMEGPIMGAAFVSMLFNPFINQPQRGTAVLGTIAASVDGVGTDGVAPMATTMFFPTQSAESGDRELLAWYSALVRLKAGDVMVPTYPSGGPTDCILLDNAALLGSGILEIAENLQITVVVPVGDFGFDVSDVVATLPANALLAAATMPSSGTRRFWSSNYVGTGIGAGNAVMCAMAPIVTTGGDCNLTRIAIDIPDGLNEPSGYINREMKQRSYTNNFGNTFDGSKAAAAQIASIAACLQGLSLQWYGGPQSPDNLRNLMFDTKRIKGGLANPPLPQPYPADAFGVVPGAESKWAYNLTGPTEGPQDAPFIGGWIDPAAAGVDLVLNPIYEVEPNVPDIITAFFIRGFQLYGDITSVRTRFDYEYLSALSQFTLGGERIEPVPYVPGTPITYFGTGEWTDLFIHGIEGNKDFVDNAVGIAVDVAFKIDPESSLDDGFNYGTLMYNFESENWENLELTGGSFDEFTSTFSLIYKPLADNYFGDYFGPGNEFNMRFTFNTFAGFVDPDDPFQDGVDFEADPFVIYYDFIDLREDGVVVP